MKLWRIYAILVSAVLLLSFLYFKKSYNLKNAGPKAEREKMLQNMDILAHPEKYPVKQHNRYVGKVDAGSKQQRATSKNQPVLLKTALDSWRHISRRFFVFSAYEDHRSRPNNIVIRVVSLIQETELVDLKVQCYFMYGNSTKAGKDTAASVVLHEQHNSTYVSAFFFCFSRGSRLPDKISLRHFNSTAHAPWLDVHKRPKKAKDIAVCIKPIFGTFLNTRIKLIAEFLGFYNALGVRLLNFYDYQMSARIVDYLKSVADDEFQIRLVRWKLPKEVAENTWQYGQTASIQDCFHRNADKEYVLVVDLDEFLVPRQHFSLPELMEDLAHRAKQKKIGSYIFRQSFFCKGKHSTGSKNDFPLVTATRLFRQSKIWPPKKRSKVMLKPNAVSECGVHFVWKHWKGWKPANVPWQLAMIHHYNDEQCERLNETLEEDRTAETFKVEVMFSKPMTVWRENFSQRK